MYLFADKAKPGHDVAEDMVDAGLSSVTMIQRSPTCKLFTKLNKVQRMLVNISSQTSCLQSITRKSNKVSAAYRKILLRQPFFNTETFLVTYNANIPTEYADQMSLTAPIGVVRLISLLVLHSMAEAEPERFDNLEKVGFKVVRKGDLIYQVFDRFGGHYIDVGASAKISNGLVSSSPKSLPAF